VQFDSGIIFVIFRLSSPSTHEKNIFCARCDENLNGLYGRRRNGRYDSSLSMILPFSRNYWVFGLCPSSGILETTSKNTAFRKLGLLLSSGDEGETPTLLGPLERANLNHNYNRPVFLFAFSLNFPFLSPRAITRIQENKKLHVR
jgi:hypothetical protein